jgi:tetratricopeptide (TPR) repeat protein
VLARRLAEDYVELEGTALREKGRNATTITSRARASAEKYYGIIVSEYPTYPLLDELLCYVGYEYELANDAAQARKAYFDLIQQRPNSRLVPYAYLAFGEMFFKEAANDPSKWGLAREAYVKVISYPPPDNGVYGYAWYKLAHVFWNAGEYDRALRAIHKTIDYGAAYPQMRNASSLAKAARSEIPRLAETARLAGDVASADKAQAEVQSPNGSAPAEPAEMF